MQAVEQAGKVRIYGCGGCGINLAAKVGAHPAELGLSAVEVVFVDTSRSNLKSASTEGIPSYLLDGVDGSGKIRRENSDAIADRIGDLLLEHRPLDLNIVCFSSAGGSGSVFGPLIVKALLERDAPVVAFMVGSVESAITATNSLNTLKSLDVIADRAAAPLVVYYNQNRRDEPRSKVDADFVNAMLAFRVLGSKQNEGLDSRDLQNFLRFDRACRAQPQLALLEIIASRDVEEIASLGINHVISVASIFRDTDALPFPLPNEYQATGYLPAGIGEAHPEELHFVVHTDEVGKLLKSLTDSVKEFDDFAKSRSNKVRIVADDEDTDASGLIL